MQGIQTNTESFLTKPAAATKQKTQQTAAAQEILHLWFAKISAATRDAENAVPSLLSASEQERLSSIGSQFRRREYLLSRATIRHALSDCFQRQPQDWVIVDKPGATPIISNLPAGFHVGLGHSKGLICFAISTCPVGIDLEAAYREKNYTALAEAFMNEAERACLADIESGRADYFYRVWSAKEAYYKWLPPAQQSDLLFSQICYSDMLAEDSRGYLYEGSIGGYVVAAMMTAQPDCISSNYFLMDDVELLHK